MALEQQCLTVFGAFSEDLLDVGAETDVEHAIGFVQDNRLQFRQIQRPSAEMVEQSARRPNHNVDTPLESFDLLANRLSAIDRGTDNTSPEGQFVNFFTDLDRQFSRGDQDECLRAARFTSRSESIENRNRKRRRLSCTGPSLCHHILARTCAPGSTRPARASAFRSRPEKLRRASFLTDPSLKISARPPGR